MKSIVYRISFIALVACTNPSASGEPHFYRDLFDPVSQADIAEARRIEEAKAKAAKAKAKAAVKRQAEIISLTKKKSQLDEDIQDARAHANEFKDARTMRTTEAILEKAILTGIGLPIAVVEANVCWLSIGFWPAALVTCGPIALDVIQEVASRSNQGASADSQPGFGPATILGAIYDSAVAVHNNSKPSGEENAANVRLSNLIAERDKTAERLSALTPKPKSIPKAVAKGRSANHGVTSEARGWRGTSTSGGSGSGNSSREYGTTMTSTPDGTGGYTIESKTGWIGD